jgi:multicomponent Na+:H+ antiporter subunit C
MQPSDLYGSVGIALFALGVYGATSLREFLRQVLALNVAGTGVFMFLIAIAHRAGAPVPDPVPHAMVLTGIVVAVSATALILVLIGRRRDLSDASSAQDDRDE